MIWCWQHTHRPLDKIPLAPADNLDKAAAVACPEMVEQGSGVASNNEASYKRQQQFTVKEMNI